MDHSFDSHGTKSTFPDRRIVQDELRTRSPVSILMTWLSLQCGRLTPPCRNIPRCQRTRLPERDDVALLFGLEVSDPSSGGAPGGRSLLDLRLSDTGFEARTVFSSHFDEEMKYDALLAASLLGLDLNERSNHSN
jgi:hypothetical protein